jgi:hypothetical protein
LLAIEEVVVLLQSALQFNATALEIVANEEGVMQNQLFINDS